MSERKIPLKNPVVAAVFAYLVPGAGHLYQGRLFKAAVYFVCILGSFYYGMHLGDWRVVYVRNDARHTHYGYYAQVLAGVSAWPAVLQSRRFTAPENTAQNTLEAPLAASFDGRLLQQSDDGEPAVRPVAGTIELRSVVGEFGPEVRGTFTGRLEDGDGNGNGEEVSFQLKGPVSLGPAVAPSPQRGIECYVVEERDGELRSVGELAGSIPRSFVNWYQVPLTDHVLEDLNGGLGKWYELAKVYTWIAGLLNILAIWDALEGPAYGYGDEDDEENRQKDRDKTQDAKAASQSTETAHSPGDAVAGPRAGSRSTT